MEQSNTMQITSLGPPEDKDLVSFKSKETGKIEKIDLRTGKIYESYLPINRSGFSNVLADLICQGILEGVSLKTTLAEHNIPMPVFYTWLAIMPEFKERYSEARKFRADYHFHKAVDLADGAVGMNKDMIPGLKLAVDTHKWAAEKSDPSRFAKPKEEIAVVGGITVILNTGVLEREAPKDIIVDQYGNFEGFGDIVVDEVDKEIIITELNKDRWGVYDGKEDGGKEAGGSDGEEIIIPESNGLN